MSQDSSDRFYISEFAPPTIWNTDQPATDLAEVESPRWQFEPIDMTGVTLRSHYMTQGVLVCTGPLPSSGG
jgi:hypothetical protein